MAEHDAIDTKTPATGVDNVGSDIMRGDVESLRNNEASTGVRRDLQRRHINMIAIAGMIVSPYHQSRLNSEVDIR